MSERTFPWKVAILSVACAMLFQVSAVLALGPFKGPAKKYARVKPYPHNVVHYNNCGGIYGESFVDGCCKGLNDPPKCHIYSIPGNTMHRLWYECKPVQGDPNGRCGEYYYGSILWPSPVLDAYDE